MKALSYRSPMRRAIARGWGLPRLLVRHEQRAPGTKEVLSP
jgi:hypothetical protein